MLLYKSYWVGPKGIEEFISFGVPTDKDYLFVKPISLEEVLMVAKIFEPPAGEL